MGHTIEYDVLEIIYRNEGQLRDTITYQLKEEITDSFKDGAGKTVFVLDRSKRSNISGTWSYFESWFAQIENNQAIRIEDNRKFVKLRLPIKPNDQWDGNALFDDRNPVVIGDDPIDYFKNWNSKMIEGSGIQTINGINYNDTHVISLADDENKLELRYGKEIYADTIGLIYRELRILDTQCFDKCTDLLWEKKAEKGHIYIQKIRK